MLPTPSKSLQADEGHVPLAESPDRRRLSRGGRALAWALGLSELFLSIALALCLLTAPAVFGWYYRSLHVSAHDRDAEAVVRWLSSTYRQRSLALAVSEGKLQPKELRHYADVREVFRYFPRLAAGFGLLSVLLLVAGRPGWPFLAAAQWRGFLCWIALVLALGGLALWDWQLFFAWLHHPFFGDESWRLSDDAYSLQLFPMKFWRIATGFVLVVPIALFGTLFALANAFRSRPR